MSDSHVAGSRPVFSWIDAATGRLSFLNSSIASLTIVAMMALICADILGRNLFSVPINGVADFVAYAIVACVFMQLGSAVRNGRLVRAIFVAERLEKTRPQFSRTLQSLFELAALAVMILTARYLWRDFLGAWETAEFVGAAGAYQIVTWPFKLAVAFGASVATAELALGLVRNLLQEGAIATSGRVVTAAIAVVLFLAFFWGLSGAADLGLNRVGIGIAAMVCLLLLIALGMPIVFALMISSFVGIWLVRGNLMVPVNSVGISASSAVRSYGFGVIPLFVLMGLLLEKAGVGRDAFQVMALLMRRITGGLGVATVGANAIFASITGSSIASASVFSRIAVPPMTEAGYTKKFSLGIVAGSSVLGMLIPPSLLMIVYGLISETSIGDLFIAGIIPGILLAGSFALVIILLARFAPRLAGQAKVGAEINGATPGDIILRLAPVFFIVALVMGGIYGGFFSPTEAGAVGALGAVSVALARRSLSWADFRQLVVETGAITAGLLFLMIAANLYARMLAMTTLPMQMANAIGALELTVIAFALLYVLIVVLLGMILDSVSIILLVVPIALPIIGPMGVDPVWFGLVTIVAVEIGLLTPPFGLSIYVVKGSLPEGYATLGEIFSAVLPFVFVMMVVTVLLIFFPALSTVFL